MNWKFLQEVYLPQPVRVLPQMLFTPSIPMLVRQSTLTGEFSSISFS